MNTLQHICNSGSSPMRAELLCVLVLLLAGCSDSDDPRSPVEDAPQSNAEQESGNTLPDIGPEPGNVTAPENTSPHRSFEYPFYDPQNCPNDPLINCSADLTLCENGTSFILITDIINQGVYAETETDITTNWELFGDVPEEIRFSVNSDGTLADNIYGYTWEPVIEGVTASECET